jgi:hypothetical protein
MSQIHMCFICLSGSPTDLHDIALEPNTHVGEIRGLYVASHAAALFRAIHYAVAPLPS